MRDSVVHGIDLVDPLDLHQLVMDRLSPRAVRAILQPESAGALRSDLDRLVTEALIPEREAAAVLRVEGRTQGAVEYRRPTAASYCYKGLGLRFRIAPVLRISHVDRQWDGQPGDALHPFAHEFGG